MIVSERGETNKFRERGGGEISDRFRVGRRCMKDSEGGWSGAKESE